MTLPLVVELFRHARTRSLTITEAERVEASGAPTWRLTLATGERPRGLVAVDEG